MLPTYKRRTTEIQDVFCRSFVCILYVWYVYCGQLLVDYQWSLGSGFPTKPYLELTQYMKFNSYVR